MDPITLATITSALTVMASEVAKGFASNVGEDLWKKVKSLLGWTSEPKPADLAPELAKLLQADEHLARRVIELLQSGEAHGSTAGALVGKIDAKNVTVINQADTVNLTMN